MAYILNAKHPVLKNGVHRITSPYGMRTHPITGKQNSMHYGIDMTGADRKTDDIIAFEDGVVIYARNSIKGKTQTYPAGNYVVITHVNAYKTRYLHMAYDTVRVKKGDTVKRGDVIGHMGTTGSSTGNHLHFEVQLNDVAIDPEPYLLGLYNIADPITGDINYDGKVDAVDYIYIKRDIMGTYDLTDEQREIADINNDGKVDAKDALLAKRIALGTYKP